MNRCALTNDNRNMRSNIFNAQQQAAAAIPGSGPGGNGGGNINQNTNTNNSNISSLPNRQMIDLIRLAINAGFLNAQVCDSMVHHIYRTHQINCYFILFHSDSQPTNVTAQSGNIE